MPNKPSDGKLLPCRHAGCPKKFQTYSGRLAHETRVHAMHKKLNPEKPSDIGHKNDQRGTGDMSYLEERVKSIPGDGGGDGEKLEPSEVAEDQQIEIEIDNSQKGMIVIKESDNGFPSIDREASAEKLRSEIPDNLSGGPVWLMIRSIARVLNIVGQQDYLEALKPVEKELKSACSKVTGRYLADLSPIQQVILFIVIAWLPIILMDLPVFIMKIKNLGKWIKGGQDDE